MDLVLQVRKRAYFCDVPGIGASPVSFGVIPVGAGVTVIGFGAKVAGIGRVGASAGATLGESTTGAPTVASGAFVAVAALGAAVAASSVGAVVAFGQKAGTNGSGATIKAAGGVIVTSGVATLIFGPPAQPPRKSAPATSARTPIAGHGTETLSSSRPSSLHPCNRSQIGLQRHGKRGVALIDAVVADDRRGERCRLDIGALAVRLAGR